MTPTLWLSERLDPFESPPSPTVEFVADAVGELTAEVVLVFDIAGAASELT
jgi:hypothetical protein